MNDRSKDLIAAGVMLVTQLAVARNIAVTGSLMSNHWSHTLPSATLPWITDLAFQFGQAIPITVAALTVFTAWSVIRNRNGSLRELLIIAVVEIIALSIYTMAIIGPTLSILYGLKK